MARITIIVFIHNENTGNKQEATSRKDVNSLDYYVHIEKSELTNISTVKESLNNFLDFEAKKKEKDY